MTVSTDAVSRYDASRDYAWNYANPPQPVACDVPAVPGDWTFCGLKAASPLGMPAGPLLNGDWILYYASLGFDVLTYKTVRSGYRECYPLPNLVPVTTDSLQGGEVELPLSAELPGSWAVSFGMPSQTPDIWRTDIERTRRELTVDKLLNVSVVGTVQPDWSIDDLAADYAKCAKWAAESGADTVEVNYSCPNVSTCDGQLYQQPDDARIVTEAVREAVGQTPLIIKIGHVTEEAEASALLDALDSATALAMTNSVAATIRADDGTLLFDGQKRGICGAATFAASLAQTQLFARLIQQRGHGPRLIGVGGASTAEHVRAYLEAGAECVHIATAAMVDPQVALKIRSELAG
ncbi:MAG: beta/alpha barrel domain-containing protein [Planctomycetota bacterium]|jgi:dihydroorotate dehydrogenase